MTCSALAVEDRARSTDWCDVIGGTNCAYTMQLLVIKIVCIKLTIGLIRLSASDLCQFGFESERNLMRRLMMKIESLGIAGNAYNWIEDGLKDRGQRVVLLGCNSAWIKVKSGAPQGSVLGPLLFLIYINGIDDVVSS